MLSKRKVPQRKPSRDPPPRDLPPRDRPRCNTSRDETPHSPPSSRCTLPDTPPSLVMLAPAARHAARSARAGCGRADAAG
eukprot:scaffold49430_cov31-Phaeocystis_antarctica.AAC.1